MPCFLDNCDNTVDSGILPNSTDESQLSQQIDIPTPFIYSSERKSLERLISPCLLKTCSINTNKTESVFIPITNNINYNNQSNSPVIISKRLSATTTSLTEKQKDRLRTRYPMPFLCDDSCDTQSLSYIVDTPTIENMMAHYQVHNLSNENKQSTNVSPSKQSNSNSSSLTQSSQENNTTIELSSTIVNNENSSIQISTNNNEDEIVEESSIVKKLRRSRRPSTSARKSLTKKKQLLISSSNENNDIISSNTTNNSSSHIEVVKNYPLKSILKRLSPTKTRQDHKRHVAFHDQVKVLLYASPSHRNKNIQSPRKKSPDRNEIQISSSISTMNSSNTRLSKLFNFSDDSKCEVTKK